MLRAIELCAGAGGASLGLELAGFEPALLIEREPNACATLRLNRPDWPIVEDDIRSVDFSHFNPGEIDLLSGGLPCPPYSIAGMQRGSDDGRDLFPAMLSIVETIRPKAVVIENVRGLLATKFQPVRDSVNEKLAALGYQVGWNELDAANFGVPQRRNRAFLVAIANPTKPFSWPMPKPPSRFVGPCLLDLLAAGGWAQAEAWATKTNKFLSPTLTGGSTRHGGPDLGPTRARNEWIEMGVHPLVIATEPPPAGFHRGKLCLTVRMVARLQGFPDAWEFYGSKTQQCRQIGNALPTPLMKAVALQIAKCLR